MKVNIINDVKQEHPDLEAHLGGHEFEQHYDHGALDTLIKKFDIKSMIDVGAGLGGMVQVARDKGLDAIGVDGDWSVERDIDIVLHDYTKGPYIPEKNYDLAWSVEFLEHVEQQSTWKYMETFKKCKYVICTHAFPNQPGKNHLVLRGHDYWVDVFRCFGFEIDPETTNEVRNASTMSEKYMRQQSLFFRNLNWKE